MLVEFLLLPSGRCPIEEFLEELDDKTVAKVYRLIEILKIRGTLPFPHARKMQGRENLWELRMLSQGKAVRIFYAYLGGNKIVIMSGFIKKSQRTPTREMDKAIQYLQTRGEKI